LPRRAGFYLFIPRLRRLRLKGLTLRGK